MSSASMDEGFPRRCLVQDKRRAADVAEKHARVRDLLESAGADALLLQDPANIAWFASGADPGRFSADGCQTSLFITDEARLFATNSVDSAQLFEREVFGLGFQLKQREWYQPHAALVEDLCRGRRVISDSGVEGTRAVGKRIARLRLPLTELDVDRLRRLSRVVVHAVEVTAGRVRRGMTEAAVAGELSHRLVRRTITPVRIQVCADGRNIRYRHWTFGEDPIESFVTLTCVAKRWGLHAAVSRTVCLNSVPPALWEAHQKAVLVHATGIYFSRNGTTLKDLWPKVRRIYEKFNLAAEWLLCDQADIIGYRPSESQLTPSSDLELQGPVPVYWHPGVQAAMPGDTILVLPGGCEMLTKSSFWPELRVQVKGHDIPCAGLLLLRDPEDAAVSSSEPREEHVPADAALFQGFGMPDDDQDGSRMDSIWEMDLSTDRTLFETSGSRYRSEPAPD